jgi:hypothetical protein
MGDESAGGRRQSTAGTAPRTSALTQKCRFLTQRQIRPGHAISVLMPSVNNGLRSVTERRESACGRGGNTIRSPGNAHPDPGLGPTWRSETGQRGTSGSGASQPALASGSGSASRLCDGSGVGVDAEQCPDLYFTVASVTARGPDAADPARRGPSGDCLGVHAEEGSNLSGGKQAITLAIHFATPRCLDPPQYLRVTPHRANLNNKESHYSLVFVKIYSQTRRSPFDREQCMTA